MINTRVAENGKKYAKLSDLSKWASNPRRASDEDYVSLKKKIVRLGLFREIFINSTGEVVGGNHRLDALVDLNQNIFSYIDDDGIRQEIDMRGKFEEVPVTEISFGEKDGKYYAILNGQPQDTLFENIEAAILEYALADNEATATWDKKALSILMQPLQKLIPMDMYKLQISPAVSLKTFQRKQAKEATADNEPKSKKVILKIEFTPDRYAEIESKLKQIQDAYQQENITDLFTTLVEEKASNLSQPIG